MSFDLPLQDRYFTGEALFFGGVVLDQTKAGGTILFRFSPPDGEPSLVFLPLKGDRFEGFFTFVHQRAGRYDLTVFLGGPEEESLESIGQFEDLEIAAGQGPFSLPEAYFPGVVFADSFPAQYDVGQEVALVGQLSDSSLEGGQLAFFFEPVGGGEAKRVFLRISDGAFQGSFLFVPGEEGAYLMKLFAGAADQAQLTSLGTFPIEVNPGAVPVFLPALFFAGLQLDPLLPTQVPVGTAVPFAGTAGPEVLGIRLELESDFGGREVPVGLEEGAFFAVLRLLPQELGPVELRVFVEAQQGFWTLAGAFIMAGVEAGPSPRIEVSALDMGIPPGGESEVVLTNRGTGGQGVLGYSIEPPFFVVDAPSELAAGAAATVKIGYGGTGGDSGILRLSDGVSGRFLAQVALVGLEARAQLGPLSRLVPRGPGQLGADLARGEYIIVLYAAALGGPFPFSIGEPAAKANGVWRGSQGDMIESQLRREGQELADNWRFYRRPAAKRAQTCCQVGQKRQMVFPALGGANNQRIEAELVAFSPRAVAWAHGGVGIGTEEIQQLLDQFSQEDYGRMVAAFGLPSDVDGDGRIAFLFTPLVDQVGGISGFFSSSSVVPEVVGGNGNLLDLIYLTPDLPGGLAAYRGLLVHEFQHLINYNQHVLVRGGSAEENWLDEGLSHLAEDLVSGPTQSGNGSLVAAFLAQPWSAGLEGNALLNTSKRGGAYLFVRRLADRLGPGLPLKLVGSGLAGWDNVEAATGEGADDLLAFWGTQLYLSGLGLIDHPLFNFSGSWLADGPKRGFGLPTALAYNGAAVGGEVPSWGVHFLRANLLGAGALTLAVDAEVAGVVIPLPAGYVPSAQMPADYIDGIDFAPSLPAVYLVDQTYPVGGLVQDRVVDRLAIQFRGEETFSFFAQVQEGGFRQDLHFRADQVGSYTLDIFAFVAGESSFLGSFGPVEIRFAPEIEPNTAVEGANVAGGTTRLKKVYPNPFNAAAVVAVQVEQQDRDIDLAVFNGLGQRVRQLHRGPATPGPNFFVWDGKDSRGSELASGVYLVRLQALHNRETLNIVLLR